MSLHREKSLNCNQHFEVEQCASSALPAPVAKQDTACIKLKVKNEINFIQNSQYLYGWSTDKIFRFVG